MEIRQDVFLAPYTTFGIGGPADYFVVASSEQDIVEAVSFAREKNIPFFLLGTGANILIGDKGYRGLVIKNEASRVILNQSDIAQGEGSQSIERDSSAMPRQTRSTPQNDNIPVLLTAESGATIADLITYTSTKGLSGLEHFAGIPSTVGGALWQNLHFLSPDRSKTMYIGDLVVRAKILKEDGTVEHVGTDYFQFTYDYSILHVRRDIVLSATFALTPEDPKIIQQRIAANISWREEKHPSGAMRCSAGSVFKKLEGYGAGRLIEQVGLKGKTLGGAKISDKHANFIINENSASAKDVRDLITLVQNTVKEQLGLQMQTEISFVGEF